MFAHSKRNLRAGSLPPYLRRIVLFDRLISGLTLLVTAAIGAGLLLGAASHYFLTPLYIAGMVLFVIGLVLSM